MCPQSRGGSDNSDSDNLRTCTSDAHAPVCLGYLGIVYGAEAVIATRKRPGGGGGGGGGKLSITAWKSLPEPIVKFKYNVLGVLLRKGSWINSGSLTCSTSIVGMIRTRSNGIIGPLKYEQSRNRYHEESYSERSGGSLLCSFNVMFRRTNNGGL